MGLHNVHCNLTAFLSDANLNLTAEVTKSISAENGAHYRSSWQYFITVKFIF